MPRAEAGPPLAELQRRFFELITAREGVARELALRELPESHVASIIAGDARASAVARLDIYANMYFFRILDVLHADYPKLRAVLGDDAFHNLATDYLQAHPSRHPSLRFVGASMPAFVGGHAFGIERPWLGALAALEWARVDVFDREDTPVLTHAALAATPPEDFATIRLATIAAFELVHVAFAVEEPWRELEADAEAAVDEVAPAPPGHALVVWRRGVTVHHRPARPREAEALALVRAGTTFGALCSALGDATTSEEEAAQQAVTFLGSWLADELLAA